MVLLLFGACLLLILGAIVIWALSGRIPTFNLGVVAIICLVALLGLPAAQLGGVLPEQTGFVWGTLNGKALELRFATVGLPTFFSSVWLLCALVTAGGLASILGRTTRAFGLVFAGLLILVLGGLLTIYSVTPVGVWLGLGVAWAGGTIMQQTATAHNREAAFGGLPVLVLALAILVYAASPSLGDDIILTGPWLAGCALLIGLAPVWGTTRTAPLLVRAPTTALGLPLLGGYLLVRYAGETATLWSRQMTTAVLLVGVFGLLLGAINALVARRLMDAFSWQLVAQLALLAVTFGTGQPAAGPIAAGLLAHAAVTSTSIALAIGQLERITRGDLFAALPPLPQPLRRAGIAYALAAMSCAGLPPLLGYALRRVVLLLTPSHPWLAPVLLAVSSLLALSYLPTLVAFFRRPAFRSPLATVEQRGGGWPLLLMVGLLLGGVVPDNLWQWILGDPSVATPQAPPVAVIISTAVTALIALLGFGIANRALRRPRPAVQFGGGEPLDEEPGWTLPFVALRRMLWPLVVPEAVPLQGISQWLARQHERLSGPWQVLERRYYLALVVVSLITVLLLAAQ